METTPDICNRDQMALIALVLLRLAAHFTVFVGVFPRQPYLRVATGVHHKCSMP
jgi:hypothetical protein